MNTTPKGLPWSLIDTAIETHNAGIFHDSDFIIENRLQFDDDIWFLRHSPTPDRPLMVFSMHYGVTGENALDNPMHHDHAGAIGALTIITDILETR